MNFLMEVAATRSELTRGSQRCDFLKTLPSTAMTAFVYASSTGALGCALDLARLRAE